MKRDAPETTGAARPAAPHRVRPRPKRSFLGVASLLMALYTVGGIVVGVAMELAAPASGDSQRAVAVNVVSWLLVGVIWAPYVGVVLGVASLSRPRRGRIYALLGLGLNCVFLLFVALSTTLAMAIYGRQSP
ncbi:MAG: hypothetical protein KGY99_10180 [Phycisphaerae bacterium]|nr:hypothetical protein [Phycisphaerae bacterium]